MAHYPDMPEVLRSLELFSGVNDRTLRFLCNACEFRYAKRREQVVQRGEIADGLFVIAQGRVEVSLSAAANIQKVVEIAGPGDQIGDAMMFQGGEHLIDARAITPVTYIWIGKADCLQAIALDPGLAVKMLTALSRRFVTLLSDIEATNCLTARERLYQLLLTEPRQGNVVRLTVTKGIIASKLGIAKETLSREFQRLSRDGLIRVKGSTIELLDLPGAVREPRVSTRRALKTHQV